ncbi:hypothetical protein [Amycolatopsis sp. NPDC051903]|uniref:hypothetical protein n=1 Tax=Amycolatopsis sp. NPDC051903 TaxID=3363936 RepID=UPI0037A71FB4
MLGALMFLGTVLALVLTVRRPRTADWTEFALVDEPTIAFTYDRLTIQGRAVRDGTVVAFRVPRAPLAVALDVFATGRLWTAGRKAGLPGHVWTGAIPFQAPGPLPDHDHA